MISIAKQTIEFYTKYFKTPKVEDLEINDSELLNEKWSVFITIYKKWEIRWSSWNIKEIKSNIVEEIIENTVHAISKDKRFKAVSKDETDDLKIRIDKIISRKILSDNEILKVDPLKSWILAIKKDYSNMACILQNINPSLLTWEDLIPILKEKFKVKDFKESEYILYQIESKVFDNFETK